MSHYKCIPFSLPSALIHPHTKHTNTQTHRLTHTHTHTNTHTHIHTQTHTLTHTHSQAHTHTQTHTHTSTHTSHTPSFLAHRDATLLQCIASLFTALTNPRATDCLSVQGRFSQWASLPLFSLRLPIHVPHTVFSHREGFPSGIPCPSFHYAYQFTCHRLSFRTGKVFPVKFLAFLIAALTNSRATQTPLSSQGGSPRYIFQPFSLAHPLHTHLGLTKNCIWPYVRVYVYDRMYVW